jgi:hypothetical protein
VDAAVRRAEDFRAEALALAESLCGLVAGARLMGFADPARDVARAVFFDFAMTSPSMRLIRAGDHIGRAGAAAAQALIAPANRSNRARRC